MELLREHLPQPPDLQIKREQTSQLTLGMSSQLTLDLKLLSLGPFPLDPLAVDSVSAIFLVPVTDHLENNFRREKVNFGSWLQRLYAMLTLLFPGCDEIEHPGPSVWVQQCCLPHAEVASGRD